MKIPNKRDYQQIVSNHSFDIDFKDFTKLYKDYTKEPYSFSVNDTTLSLDNSLRFRKDLLLSISGEIKAMNNKIEQNKAQYSSDRQTAEISALSSGNVCKNEFLTGKDALPEKDLLEKAAALKRFEDSPFGKEFNAQTYIAKKQYKNLTMILNQVKRKKS